MTAESTYRQWLVTHEGRDPATYASSPYDDMEFGLVRTLDRALPELLDPAILRANGRGDIDYITFALPTQPGLRFCMNADAWFEGMDETIRWFSGIDYKYHVGVYCQNPTITLGWISDGLDTTAQIDRLTLGRLDELRTYSRDDKKVAEAQQRVKDVRSCVLV